MIVIGIIGAKGSGKETAARYLANRYNGKNHSHSEIFSDVLSVLNVPHTRMNYIRLVELRKIFGENTLVNALNKKLRAENADLEVVTGIRFQNELENIRSYPNNYIVFIDADPETRFKHQLARKQQYEDDRSMSFEEFMKIDSSEETEKHIHEFKTQADYVISNDGTLEDLYAKLNLTFDPLLKK